MVNAKTRNQWKARLDSTEGLPSSARDGKGEAEVQQAQFPSVVGSERKKSRSRKRELGEVLEEQESAALEIVSTQNDVQDCTRGKSILVRDSSSVAGLSADCGKGTMESCNPRALAHQRPWSRVMYDAPAENNVSPDTSGKETVVCIEGKKGKREASCHKVQEHGKEKAGDAVSCHKREPIPNRKRRNLLNGLGEVSEDVANVAGPLTRGMIKPGTNGLAEIAHIKKRRRFRPEEKATDPLAAEFAGAEIPLFPSEEAAERPNVDLPINVSNVESSNKTAECGTNGLAETAHIKKRRRFRSEKATDPLVAEFAGAEIPLFPSEEAAERPNVDLPNISKAESSNKTAECDRVLDTKTSAPLESPADVSGLNHVPLQAGTKLSKPSGQRKYGKSNSEVHLVKVRLPKPSSPRVTRGMKGTGSDPTVITNGSPILKGDPKSGSNIDEPLDQAAVPTTAVETASMQLRNQKKVGEKITSAGRPRKRVKKNQDEFPAGTCQKVAEMMKASDSMLNNRIANGSEGVGVIDLAASDSQVNHTEPERNSSLNKNDDNGGGPQLSSTEGVHTKGSKMDGPSGIEPQVGPDLLPSVAGFSVQYITGRVEKGNDEDTRHTKECTEGGGRKGGRLGRTKKREKKKIDPGGDESVQDKKASDQYRNAVRHDNTHKCKLTKESSQLGPGPSNKSQLEPGKQGIDAQNSEGMALEAAGKSQKAVEFAEMRDKTGVEKSVQLTETDGECQLTPKTLLENESDDKEKKLDTVTPREGPSKPVGVLTRGSKVDGRNSTGPANGSIEKKFKTKGNSGRRKTGRMKVDSGFLFQIPKRLAENSGEDSAHEKAVEERKTALQDEQIHEYAQVEESTRLGHGPICEVRMGLGEEGFDVQGIESDTIEGAGRHKELSELHNGRFGEKGGLDKSVELTETDGQVGHHDQPDKAKENGVQHYKKVLPRKLPVRTKGVLTRGRKVDVQCDLDMECGHSDQTPKRARKKTSDVGNGSGSASEKVETRAHLKRSKEGAKIVDSRGLPTDSDYQPDKDGAEATLAEKTGEGEIVKEARNMENGTELQDRRSEQVKGTEVLVEKGWKKNHLVQALENTSSENHDLGEGEKFESVNLEKNPTRGRGTKFSRRVGEKDVPAKDSSLLTSSVGCVNLDIEKVSADAEKIVEMPSKKKREKQATGTDGDSDRQVVASHESPASVRVTTQSLEPSNKSSADCKGRRGGNKKVKKTIAADLKPSLEITHVLLPIEDENVTKESCQGGSCNRDKGQEELSKGSPVPKRRKTGTSRIIPPMVTEGNSKVVPEVAHSRVTELSSGQGVDSGVVQSNGSGGQHSLLDDVVQVTLEASQVGLQIGSGNAPDQGEPCSCDGKGQEKLPKELFASTECNTCRSQVVSSTTVTGDGSTVKETSEEINLKNSSYEHEVALDIQSEHVEGRAEPLNVAVEVAQNESPVVAEIALQSSDAQGGPDSVQVPVRKKKLWRKKDYGRGIEFQRITRGRDSKGKSVSDNESQGGKNGTMADVVIGEHVEIRAEGAVSTTEISKNSLRLKETDAHKEDPERGKSFLDVSDLLGECATASPNNDIAGATIEQEKEAVKVMEAQKSLPPESIGTDVFAVQEAENSEEATSTPSSVLNHFEQSKTGEGESIEESKAIVQGALNGEQNDLPESSYVRLPNCQQKNVEVPELVSNLPDSPDGPFALEDGKSLTLHCRQEKASNLDDGGLHLEQAHPPNFEKMCAKDVNHLGAPHGVYSTRTLDKSEFLNVVKIPEPVASVDKSDPVVTIVESVVIATMVESSNLDDGGLNLERAHPPNFGKICAEGVNHIGTPHGARSISTLDQSESLAVVKISDPVASVDQSDPVVTVVESSPVATSVQTDPLATVLELDLDTVESDPVATIVKSDPCAIIVESDPVATTNESDTVPPTVELDLVGTIVDPDLDATVVESDSFNVAEGGSPISFSDSSSVDKQNSTPTENMFVAVPTVGKPERVARVTESDSITTPVTRAVHAVSIAIVEKSSVPTDVACEIGSVSEFGVGSEKTIGECLITEAVKSRQEQGTLEVPLEDSGFRDDNATKSPLLEREGFRQTGKVAAIVEQGQPIPVEDSVRQPTSNAEDLSCASSEQCTKEKESMTESELSTSLRGGACVELLPSDCLQLELTGQKCAKESTDVVELEQFAADRTLQERSRFLSVDHSLLDQKTERGFYLSENVAQKSVCFAASALLVGVEQVGKSRSAKSIAVHRKEGSITSPTSRSSLDDVYVEKEPLEEKLPSGFEDLHLTQSQSEGLYPDEPIVKKVDVELEDMIEVHDETKKEDREVHIEADGLHIEVKEVHSETGEILTDAVGVQSEAKEVNFKEEEANLVVGTPQADGQTEVHEVEVEDQLVDGTEELDHISLNEDVGSVSAGAEGKQLNIKAKEMHVGANGVHYELDLRTEVNEVNEVNAQQEVDAEAKDALADEVRYKNQHARETVLGLDNMGTTSTRQPPPSNNLVPGCDSSLSDAGQTMSVPKIDISKLRGSDSPSDQQTGPSKELMNSEPVTLETEKYVQLDGQELCTLLYQQDPGQGGQLTSALEARRCLEDDVLHPEELSDIQLETHEKDDPKTQRLRLEDPISQRNMTEAKASLISKKRKGRTGIEAPKEAEGGGRVEDGSCRVYSKRKGFLLASTSIESGGMRIRPRPLDPDQSIPILVEGRDKDFHDYDGGSFYRWVQQQEEAKLKILTVDPVADGVSEGGGLSIVSRTDLVKKRRIFIPLFRKLPVDKQTNGRIVTRPEQNAVLGMQSPFPRPQAYLRQTKPAARKLGHALGGSFCTVPSVYDMDDEDEEWLQAYNEILKHSGADQLLSDDTFEKLMELFEREFYRICQINDKFLPVLPRNPGENLGASGRRGKRLIMDPSQRPSRLEANKDGARFSKSMEFFQGALSQKEIERRFALQNRSEDCCICNGGENSDSNPVRRCQICSINVHESCYGICATEGNEFGHHAESLNWRCRKCEAVVGGRALPSISCAICCKSGGAMKPTVDPLKWAHIACALYTNETFFIDTEAMEPVDGLPAVETRVKKQRERCGLCGAREGSCVRCSTRGCRTPFHISCGVSQGASFEFRHTKQQVEGIRSFCPHHATLVPGTNMDEIHYPLSKADDAGEPLPAVSTESSDTLEMRHVERINMGEGGNGTEDAVLNGDGWQGSFSNKTKLYRSESKRYFRKIRRSPAPRAISAGGITPSNLDPNSSPLEISEKDMHGVSRSLPRSGSMAKENMHGVSQYMDETDPYVHQSDAERLESEAVSAATSASSSHLTTFETLDNTGKATSNVDEVDPVILAAKDKSVTWDAEVSYAVSLKFPSLEILDTNLVPPPIVKAVYSFWQVKRVKSKGPILHELRQLQVARSQGIFNKIVHRGTDLLPPVVHDSPARMPVTRRPRSLSRDPIFSKFSELRQQLEILRSIASNVVRREQVKLEDQKLIYESVQQHLLIAREAPRSRRCLWCENTQSLLNCSSCLKAFCFHCFKHRRGYGVKGWIAASKLSKYVCNFCLGSIAQERGWPELSTTFSDPRGTPVSRVALGPGRLGDWNHGLEVRTKPNSGKQVSFLNETSSNPYESSSSPREGTSTMAPGRGKMIYSGRSVDGHSVHSKFAVPGTNGRSGAVDRPYQGGVASSGPNDPAGNHSRVQLDHPHGEGKKVKRRRVKVVDKEVEPKTVMRATKRIKKLARSSSFVYGSEDETTVSENEEIRIDKRTVKLSDLRDKEAKSQSTNLLDVGPEDKAETRHPPLKFGIKFSPTGTLIVRRHGPPQHP